MIKVHMRMNWSGKQRECCTNNYERVAIRMESQ